MAKKVKNVKIRESAGDKILNVIIGIFLVLIVLVVAYPIMYVISSSFSSTKALQAGRVFLWPVEFTLEAYEFVFQYKQVWVGFRNTIFYTIGCTFILMASNILVAYPLSRRYLKGRTFYTMIVFFTTRISAGLIPQFIWRTSLGMFDNIWCILLDTAVGVSSILILRTAINTNIPSELFDAAMIDGSSHFQCLVKLALPLVKPTMAVLTLYAIIGQWNSFFTAMIYLRDSNLFPLQLVLRPIMTAASAQGQNSMVGNEGSDGLEAVRYAMIVISTTPIVVFYFVTQKFFKGGITLGSVKG